MVKNMFLVHAHFAALGPFGFPGDTGESVHASLSPADQVEHVSVHPTPPGGFVLGFFLLAGSLAEAEVRTEKICRRLLDEKRLPPAVLREVGVPLIIPLLPPMGPP
ncbi:MAG TPA: hypothetical protein VN520_11905 [Streptomyces sp.]|uniref:hypothetical protein n=1 Tax=Streptomyces sp. TaxID=1931 RepID=UPI002CA96A1B|nr:hypothetical protein [Streptomyces sp.]HWU07068.1 hypothetical protein [Streptomyces sp.]